MAILLLWQYFANSPCYLVVDMAWKTSIFSQKCEKCTKPKVTITFQSCIINAMWKLSRIAAGGWRKMQWDECWQVSWSQAISHHPSEEWINNLATASKPKLKLDFCCVIVMLWEIPFMLTGFLCQQDGSLDLDTHARAGHTIWTWQR